MDSVNMDSQSPQHTTDKDQERAPCLTVSRQWWLLATVALVIGCVGIVTITILKVQGDKHVYNFGIVIDVGSTESTLFVYRWEGDNANRTAIVTEILKCDVKGPTPMAGYTANPDQAGPALKPCLDEAKGVVPRIKHGRTAIYLGATAGMRQLEIADNATCQTILKSVRKTIKGFPFMFDQELQQARILHGGEEAVFSWVAANYLAGTLGQESPATLGSLDLGGGSAEITFLPEKTEDLPAEFFKDLVLYGHQYKVYTHSYPCYGHIDAYSRLLATLVMDQGYEKTVLNPCGPTGYSSFKSYSEIFNVPCTLDRDDIRDTTNQNTTFEIVGTSNSSQCLEAVSSLFNKTCPPPMKTCGFDGVYQPPVHGNFVAFDQYIHPIAFLNLGPGSSLQEFVEARDKLCGLDWQQILPKYPSTPQYRVAKKCFIAQYVHQLLTEGYNFSHSNWKTISFQQRINNVELGWSLGYMLMSSNIVPAEVAHPPFSIWVFALLVILFLLFIVIGIAFGLTARRASKDPEAYQQINS